ncbi:MAG: FMN reductase (NADH) RutF [Methanoregula sp. PtaU1.Bin051]|nr:MAG: FMN reductase (NADH) RutF [Methanoregula sp. PtaU1.Bin051]
MRQSFGARPIAYPLPVLVVGTYDHEGKPNAMLASWGGLCSSDPPAIAVSIRSSRYTYRNLMEKREFTVSIPSEGFITEADFFGITSGTDTDKFATTGLTPIRSTLVDAPFVKEFPVVLECRLTQKVDVGSHVLFIGQIMDVKIDESVLDADGKPVLKKINPLGFDVVNSEYYTMGTVTGKAFSSGKKLLK